MLDIEGNVLYMLGKCSIAAQDLQFLFLLLDK